MDDSKQSKRVGLLDHPVDEFVDGSFVLAIELTAASGGPSMIASGVGAVADRRPNWAIEDCIAQAEANIENGQHDRYRTAVRWLKRAGTVTLETDRFDECRD